MKKYQTFIHGETDLVNKKNWKTAQMKDMR